MAVAVLLAAIVFAFSGRVAILSCWVKHVTLHALTAIISSEGIMTNTLAICLIALLHALKVALALSSAQLILLFEGALIESDTQELRIENYLVACALLQRIVQKCQNNTALIDS